MAKLRFLILNKNVRLSEIRLSWYPLQFDGRCSLQKIVIQTKAQKAQAVSWKFSAGAFLNVFLESYFLVKMCGERCVGNSDSFLESKFSHYSCNIAILIGYKLCFFTCEPWWDFPYLTFKLTIFSWQKNGAIMCQIPRYDMIQNSLATHRGRKTSVFNVMLIFCIFAKGYVYKAQWP